MELGALATTGGDVSRQVSRRAALNLSELIRGRPTSHLRVTLAVNTRLIINARTAAAIGYGPDVRTRILAHFLHPEALESEEEPLTLDRTLQMALDGNITLSISEQDVETAFQRQRVAQSAMLPQAYTPATYHRFNPRGLDGFIPDKTFSLGVYLRQMIYDDRVVTDYKSAGKDYEASREALETQRMNVLATAGASFLDLTLSRILYRHRGRGPGPRRGEPPARPGAARDRLLGAGRGVPLGVRGGPAPQHAPRPRGDWSTPSASP